MNFTWPIVVLVIALVTLSNVEDWIQAWLRKDEKEDDEYELGFDQAAGMLLTGMDIDHIREFLQYSSPLRFDDGVEHAISNWQAYITYRRE